MSAFLNRSVRVRVSTSIIFAMLLVTGGSAQVDLNNNETEFYELMRDVASIVVQPDGKIVVATGGFPGRGFLGVVNPQTGAFGNVLGGIFRFNPDGSLDHGFNSRIGPNSTKDVFETRIALQRDGKILAQGEKGELVRLQPDGRLDDAFHVDTPTNAPGVRANGQSGAVFYGFGIETNGSLAEVGKGQQEIDPSISSYTFTIPFPAIHYFDPNGQLVRSATNSPPVRYTGALVDGGFILLEPFIGSKGPGKPSEIISLSPVSRPIDDQFKTPEEIAAVKELFEQIPVETCRIAQRMPDGGIAVIAQAFGNARLLRFDRDWNLDSEFKCNLQVDFFSRISMAVDNSGRLFIAGNLKSLNGAAFPGVARLKVDGSTDPEFHVEFDGYKLISTLAVDHDDRLLIGGSLRKINGVDVPNFARLNTDGSVDKSFQRRFDHTLFANSLKWTKVFAAGMRGVAVPVGTTSGNTNGALLSAVKNTRISSGSPSSLEPLTAVANTAPTVSIVKCILTNSVAEIHFRGSANHVYTLQAQDALQTDWTNIATNQTDATGKGLFVDQDVLLHPVRFYRMTSDQP